MYRLSKRSASRLRGINHILIKIIKEAIKDSPYDFGIPVFGGKRSSSEQYVLYLRGKSNCDGYKKKSYHQSGNAFDIFLYIDGKASWNKNKLEKVAKHIIGIAESSHGVILRWGGDWDGDGIRVDKDPTESFFDGAHFEIKKQ